MRILLLWMDLRFGSVVSRCQCFDRCLRKGGLLWSKGGLIIYSLLLAGGNRSMLECLLKYTVDGFSVIPSISEVCFEGN